VTIIVLKTPEGKKVVCNTGTDEILYKAPINPPNTGTAYTRGTDLYTHVSRSGNRYFYFRHWSMWQGEEGSYELISSEEAKNFLLDKMHGGYWAGLEDSELERAKELFPDFLEEDA
jgi:hypothetical protein